MCKTVMSNSSPRLAALAIGCLSSCALLAVGLANPAQAADLPQVDGLYSPAGPVPVFTWTGGYVGVQAGASQLGARVKSGGRKKEFDKGAFSGGIYGGYNWHVSRFVLGLEADATFLDLKATTNHPTLGRVKARNNWSVGVKGRVGLPIDRFMPYVTAGVSATDYQLTTNGTKRKTKNVSLTLGGGLEYALTDQVHLRADYTLSGVNAMTKNFGNASVKNQAANHRLMLGVSYKF